MSFDPVSYAMGKQAGGGGGGESYGRAYSFVAVSDLSVSDAIDAALIVFKYKKSMLLINAFGSTVQTSTNQTANALRLVHDGQNFLAPNTISGYSWVAYQNAPNDFFDGTLTALNNQNISTANMSIDTGGHLLTSEYGRVSRMMAPTGSVVWVGEVALGTELWGD